MFALQLTELNWTCNVQSWQKKNKIIHSPQQQSAQ